MNKLLYEEQPQVLEELNNMVKKGRVPHALIFYGEKSTSKKEVAKEFSKMLYESFFKSNIESYELYHLIDIEKHPNIKHIKRDSKSSITIDYAREIIDDSSMYSEYPGPMIYIFEDADYFNSSSINSILKFVEEPKDNTYIIFLVDNLSNLLPTIQSRSILLNFKPLDKYKVVNLLEEEGFDKEILLVFTEFRQNEEDVRNLYNNQKYIDIYNQIVDIINEPFEKNGSLVLSVNEAYKSFKEEEYLEFFISLLVFMFEDILKLKNGNNNVVYIKYINRLKELSILFDDKKLIDTIKNLLELKSYVSLKKQVNVNLYLNSIFLNLEISATGKR